MSPCLARRQLADAESDIAKYRDALAWAEGDHPPELAACYGRLLADANARRNEALAALHREARHAA